MQCTGIFIILSPLCAKPVATDSCYKLLEFDLQLFAGEKTEEATPKHKEEARKKGQVAKSVEINTAFIVLAAFFALKLIGPYTYSELINFMRLTFSNLTTADFTMQSIYIIFLSMALVLLKTMLPIMLILFFASLVVNFLQVGFLFSWEPIMPNLDRINPISGFGRLFSKRSLEELFKAIFKVSIISYFIYRFIVRETTQMPALITADLHEAVVFTSVLTLDLAFQIGAVILVMAAMDYFYQWWEHKQSLMMSKEDIKQEFKQTEGNPELKGKIKERQRAMAMRRMMQEVPKADVIITNPTHFAVALKYDKTMVAPLLLAKGQDFIAERIKETAREHRIAIVENKPLARALYKSVDIGQSIPADLYQAVAEVLAYVYRLKKRL